MQSMVSLTILKAHHSFLAMQLAILAVIVLMKRFIIFDFYFILYGYLGSFLYILINI
jgi:hypothetical protein